MRTGDCNSDSELQYSEQERDRKVKTPINVVLFVLFGSFVPVLADEGNGSIELSWPVVGVIVAAAGLVLTGILWPALSFLRSIKRDNKEAHDGITKNVEKVEAKVEKVEAKVEKVEAKVEKVEAKVEKVNEALQVVREDIGMVKGWIQGWNDANRNRNRSDDA